MNLIWFKYEPLNIVVNCPGEDFFENIDIYKLDREQK